MARTLNITTLPYSTTNSVKITVAKESNPLAVIDSQTLAGPLAQTLWSFMGLEEGIVYRIRILEVSGSTVIQQYASWNVTVLGNSIDTRPPETIVVGTTLGFDAGSLTATFDGTGSKPDYRGWEIVARRRGSGAMRPDELSWDKITGLFTILDPDNPLNDQETFEIEFIPKAGVTTTIVQPIDLFLEIKYVRVDTVLTPDDFRKKVLIKGYDPYIEITLPDIVTVPPNKIIYFESSMGSHKGGAVVSSNSNKIDWLGGNRTKLYFGVGEDFAMYREQEMDDTGALTGFDYWRVHNANGNFTRVGEEVSQYANLAMVYNKIELDGGGADGLLVVEHARFYYDYVSQLPGAISFSLWQLSKQNFSLESGGRFRVPDARNLYDRVSDGTNTPGDYQEMMLQAHGHSIQSTASGATAGQNVDVVRGGNIGSVPTQGQAGTGKTIGLTGGAETRPKTRIVRKFLLS